MKHRISPSRTLGAAVLATALAGAPTAAQAQTALDIGRSAHETFARYTAQAKACHTDRPVNDAVMAADRDLSLKLAAVADPVGVPALAEQSVDPAPCDSPAHLQAMNSSALTYWQWFTRLRAMQALAARPGWTAGLAVIDPAVVAAAEPDRLRIEQLMIKAMGEQAVATYEKGLEQEAQAVFAAMCPARRTVRSATPRACPGAADPGEANAARIRVELAESAALALAAAQAREARGEVGQPYRLRDGSADPRKRCSQGDTLIYPHAADTKPGTMQGTYTVQLHRHGEAKTFGTALIQPTGDGGISVVVSAALNVMPGDFIHPTFTPCTLD